ncbi:MAG: membrane protein required for colicin V production, partial [Limisphaerales bacterium]
MIIDIIFALLVALALFHGWQKGIISSVVSVVAIGIALIAAIKLSEVASIYINNVLNIDSKFLPIVSLVIVFLVVLIGFRAMSGLVE